MPTTIQLRQRLIEKLQELFQLNQPDLDFGFYKIMHAKAEQVTQFIEQDLLTIIETAFGEVDEGKRQALQQEYEQAVQLAISFGAPNPEETDGVKAVKAKLAQCQDATMAEGEIYDRLYRFFSRYYDDGDFMSQRFYGRETAGRAATYAIPYGGEEVKLHWANADQFYIKTAEYFNRYTVNLREAEEVKKNQGPLALGLNESPLRVTFTLVEGSEGEHGNVKAGDNTKRFFRIAENSPVALLESGELVINFLYRPDPEKGQTTEGKWREKRNEEAVERVLVELEDLAKSEPRYGEFLALLQTPAPTEKQRDRPLLAKYINQYTARNTMDYFIHKDLGSFLRRELDFYIKNEVMRLDDIENADCPAVESYLAKIKVLRSIARQLIDFLAQLEDFQKKLWLKKKFVTETQYCLTLDRIPESFYPEIAANEAQRQEWVKLFAIDEIQGSEGDLLTSETFSYSEPLKVEFLWQNQFLALDTQFFDEDFKARLLAKIDNFDDQCDGVLIHSENFQALNLLQERYREQVKCVYIDPPYNTGNDGFCYKDNYQHSSWLSMIEQNLFLSQVITNRDNSFFSVSIDKRQLFDAKLLLEESLKIFDFVNAIVNVNNPKGRSDQKHLPTAHENLLLFATDGALSHGWEPADKVLKRYKKQDEDGTYREIDLRKTGDNDLATDRPNMYYAFAYNEEIGDLLPIENDDSVSEGYFLIYPMKDKNTKGCWRWELKTSKQNLNRLIAKYQPNKQQWSIFEKDYLGEDERVFPTSVWDEKAFNSERGTETFINLGFLKDDFPRPKPVGFLMYLLEHLARDSNYILDYFAGSGTTAHAVINLNREDNGQRKYILVEMGDHFNTVLKPRIQKVVYAQNWKDGKPKERDSGISHCFKYLRLESYEDTLNNLELNPVNSQFLQQNEQLQREYLLHYLLDIETKGSQSLLNIDNFANPTDYRLKIKIPGTDEYQEKAIDLIETFNYLIGLRVISIDAPQCFRADTERQIDPELPDRQEGKLVIKGKLKSDPNGQWWFRKIEGTVPKNPHTPNDGLTENVLIVWRNLTGNLEQDNLILDEWFQQNRINPKDFEYDIIYVNGSNNLPNLLREEDHWKVRLIEETFHQKMWDMGGF